MAGNYNVDDILAEINSKRQKEEERANPPKIEKKEESREVPFQLAGLTGEFPAQEDKPEKKRDNRPYYEDTFPPATKRPPKKPFNIPKPKKNTYFDEDDLDFTLTMEIDTNSSEKILQDDKGRTVVLPKVRELSKQLKSDREEKIRDFMANSDFEDSFTDEFDNDGFSFGEEEKDEFKKTLGLKKPKKTYGDDEEFTSFEEEKPKKKRRKKHNEDFPEDSIKQDFEYTGPADAPSVLEELGRRKKAGTLKLFATGAVFLVLLYLSLCNLYPLPLISFICPENNMRIFLLVNLLVFLIGAMVKSIDIGNGLVSFFTFKSDNDSPMALATLAVVIQGTYAAFKSDYIFTGEGQIYFAVAGLILFMNSFGKLLTINRVFKNFRIVTDSKELKGEYMIEDSSLAYSLSEGQGFDEANITYSKKVKFPSEFINLSFSDNYFEQSGKIITPLFVLFGLIMSVISFFLFDNGFNEALTIFTVVMCMASPLTATMAAALPLYKSACALSPEGSFVSGYDAVDKFEDTNGILLDARELYHPEDVILHGIKVFGDMRIDKSLVEAASLMYASDGILKGVFLDTIQGQLSMLKKVTDLRSYEGGIGGMCGDTEVLMGSRELMDKFSVPLPSRDYEQKFLREDGKVIYLASNGNLSAMIVVSYKSSEEAEDYLDKLKKYAPAIIVKSDDPNIDAKKIAEDFDYPEEFITMVKEKDYGRVDEIRRPTAMAKAYAMASPSSSRLRLITALVSLKKNITTTTVLQMAGLILGYAMVALMAFTGNLKMLGFLQIIIYQLFWAITVAGFGAMGRY